MRSRNSLLLNSGGEKRREGNKKDREEKSPGPNPREDRSVPGMNRLPAREEARLHGRASVESNTYATVAILLGFNLIPRQSLPAGGRRKHPRSVMPHLHLHSFPSRGRVKLALTFLNDPEQAARGPGRADYICRRAVSDRTTTLLSLSFSCTVAVVIEGREKIRTAKPNEISLAFSAD